MADPLASLLATFPLRCATCGDPAVRGLPDAYARWCDAHAGASDVDAPHAAAVRAALAATRPVVDRAHGWLPMDEAIVHAGANGVEPGALNAMVTLGVVPAHPSAEAPTHLQVARLTRHAYNVLRGAAVLAANVRR